MTLGAALIITVASWLTPSPRYARGLIVNYGNQSLIEANALYRGYDLSPYPNRCGVSAISPSDLGKIFWLRVPGGEWIGGCLAVDVGARVDFADQIAIGEIAEAPDWMMIHLGAWYSVRGEVYFGACPPKRGKPAPFAPALEYTTDHTHPFIAYPPQQLPVTCAGE